ncbi:MAG: HEPN domain-containing protein [Nitrososphaerales archaeon]
MNLSDLLNKGLVEKFSSNQEQVKDEIKIATRDLASAKNLLSIKEWEWAHNIAYNAMLQSGTALMFSKGYRPKGQEHHVAVIEFIQVVYSAKFESEVLQAFDKARKRRAQSVYDKVGSISESQARFFVEKAEAFVNRTLEILKA